MVRMMVGRFFSGFVRTLFFFFPQLIRLWAEKEFHNLRRLQRASIPSPKPVLIKKHILVMSFIGDDHRPAPKLKEARLSQADLCVAYEQVVEVRRPQPQALAHLITHQNVYHSKNVLQFIASILFLHKESHSILVAGTRIWEQ